MKKLIFLYVLLFLSQVSANQFENALLHAREIAANPEIITKVRERNKNGLPPELFGMSQEKWVKLSVISPPVKSIKIHPVSVLLKKLIKPYVSEAFISTADGTKLAFIEKTSNWNHKSKPKHDLPMLGKEWIGKTEIDESSGVLQVQVAVPILDNQVPIGSLVIGISVVKYEEGK